MSILKLCSAILLSFAALAGCSGDCKKASDCALGEVCYNEQCQRALAPFFEKSCQSDLDCDGDGDGQTELFCELGRCRFKNNNPIVLPDTGVGGGDGGDGGGLADMGPRDTGFGIPDTGTSTGADT